MNQIQDGIVLEKELLVTYLSRRVEDLHHLRVSFHSGSVTPFNEIGHKLMGTARSYGYPELETIAKQMDSVAVEDLRHRGPDIIDALSNWIEATQAQLK